MSEVQKLAALIQLAGAMDETLRALATEHV